MWGDVVFYDQSMPYSQSARVLLGYWLIGSLFSPLPPLPIKNTPTPNNVTITSCLILGAANMAAPILFQKLKLFFIIMHMFPPLVLVELARLHQCFGGTEMFPPI